MENTGDGNAFTAFLESIAAAGLRNQEVREGDWFEGDILYCKKCGKPRRKQREICGKRVLTAEQCDCDVAQTQEEQRREQEAENQKRVMELKRASLMDEKFRSSSFDGFVVNKDNERQFRLSVRYCEKFPEMLARNQGLLFYGPVGTGKTYLSACIGNRLMENLHSVFVTSFVKLLQSATSFRTGEDEETFIRRMNSASLCIIDDLDAERGTSYSLEKVYNIVDSRYRVGKPIIYTTNLTLAQMKETTDVRYSRIYDRIFETCYPVEFRGQSWRKKEAARRYENMKTLLED